MRPSFHPRLINGPFGDPCLYLPFIFENRAILFDLGDIHLLSSRDILKISHVFVTHTHMDHFVGFDRLVRLLLGREKTLHIFGPEGIIANIEGKLAGYTWNLVEHYTNSFVLTVTEVRPDEFITVEYRCQNRFIPTQEPVRIPFGETLLSEPAFTISTAIMDHNLPCLGFSIKERFHVNIMKDRVAALGLTIGPWLKSFKQALFNHMDPESEITVASGKNGGNRKTFVLKDLAEQIAMITPGQKVSYIVDVGYTPSNEKKMVLLADEADHLFIEAAFLEKHRSIATNKHHLTARQAGTIAAKARVRQFTIFHFSPRYTGQEQRLFAEAEQAYQEAVSSEA